MQEFSKKQLAKVAIQKRKKRDRQRRKEEIIEAARTVFLEKGYLNATMQDIAIEAGLTKITIYRYYKSKDRLAYSLIIPVVEALGDLLGEMEKNLDAGKYENGIQFAGDYFDLFYQFYKISPDTLRLLHFLQYTGLVWKLEKDLQSSLNLIAKKNRQTNRRIYQKAMDRGFVKKFDVDEILFILYGTFLGLIQYSELRSHRAGIGSDAETAKEMLPSRFKLLWNILIDSIVCK